MHYYPDIKFVDGKENGVADHLSRFPVYQTKPKEVSVPEEVSHRVQHMSTIGGGGGKDE